MANSRRRFVPTSSCSRRRRRRRYARLRDCAILRGRASERANVRMSELRRVFRHFLVVHSRRPRSSALLGKMFLTRPRSIQFLVVTGVS